MSTAPGAVLITGCSSRDRPRDRRASWPRRAGPSTRPPAGPSRSRTSPRRGCKTLALDVTDEASMRAAVAAVEEAEGAVGALVNNAGYSQSGAVETLPMETLRGAVRDQRLRAVRMCQLVLPGMREPGRGRIVNISSMGGKLTFPGGGAYHATKYAVEALSDALRFEVRGLRGPGGDRRAGPDHDPVRRDGRRLDRRRRAARPRPTVPTRSSTRRSAPRRRRLRGADGAARRRAGDGREGDRAGDLSSRNPRPRYKVTAVGPAGDRAAVVCSPTGPGMRSCEASFRRPGPPVNKSSVSLNNPPPTRFASWRSRAKCGCLPSATSTGELRSRAKIAGR